MRFDTTWPIRSSTKLTTTSARLHGAIARIALEFVEVSGQFLLPGHSFAQRALAGSRRGSDGTRRFLAHFRSVGGAVASAGNRRCRRLAPARSAVSARLPAFWFRWVRRPGRDRRFRSAPPSASRFARSTVFLLDDGGRRRRGLGIRARPAVRSDRAAATSTRRRFRSPARRGLVGARRAASTPRPARRSRHGLQRAPIAATIQIVRGMSRRVIVLGHRSMMPAYCGFAGRRPALAPDRLGHPQAPPGRSCRSRRRANAPARPSTRHRARRDRRAGKCGDPCLRPPSHPASARDRRASPASRRSRPRDRT